MKVLITNPDTMGDLILRQPLFNALLDEGHTVAVIVRKEYEILATQLDGRLVVFPSDLNPYNRRELGRKKKLGDFLRRLISFDPDRVVVAPFHRTPLDNRIVASLPRAESFCLSGYPHTSALSFDPSDLRFSFVANCPEDVHEIEKNRRLVSLFLGRDIAPDNPRIVCPTESIMKAQNIIAGLGLTEGEYSIANIAGFANNPLKIVNPDTWRRVFQYVFSAHGARVLFVGNVEEERYIDAFLAPLQPYNRHFARWIGDQSNLDILVGLTALSGGHIGHDTGTMHLAAALGRPVFAIFGGGHWPRFLPLSERGCVLTRRLPCFGCRWRCSVRGTPCINGITPDEIIQRIDPFITGEIEGLTIHEITPRRTEPSGSRGGTDKLRTTAGFRVPGLRGLVKRAVVKVLLNRADI